MGKIKMRPQHIVQILRLNAHTCQLLVDAIVDLTETGSSLRANNLRIVDTILTSTTRFIANKKSWKNAAKRAKLEQLKMLLTGALECS